MARAVAEPDAPRKAGTPILRIRDLQVYYGESHAIQGVDLALDAGILSIVGRNGMGKTTLCNTIVGLKRARSGSIALAGREILGLEPHEISKRGIGYVPQGRRVWRSLSVDEHLRLAQRGGRDAAWTVERVYGLFPRLAERRANGGAELSGGEQQMLAIGRALLGNPRLLVMDEPTEGLAPIIVDQVADMLVRLGEEGELAVLVIEQNIGVASRVAETVGVMVNGQIDRLMPSAALAADRDLQQRLLGVGRHTDDPEAEVTPIESAAARDRVEEVFRVARHGGTRAEAESAGYRTATSMPNRWGLSDEDLGRGVRGAPAAAGAAVADEEAVAAETFDIPLGERAGRTAFVVGTFDTKGRELKFIRDRLRELGLRTRTVDLSTSGRPSSADVSPQEVAQAHPRGAARVFGSDRGESVAAMAEAFALWMARQRDVGGIISAGGSGGTSLATAGMRRLPVGLPKLMISTVASGEVGRYVGPADITMMYSVADIQGLNSITEAVLANGAHALAGMIARAPSAAQRHAARLRRKPALGLTMFGVTTPCVQAVAAALEAIYECLVFHATGTGGQSMEALAQSGLLAAAVDVSTTEVADLLVGGVFPAHADRLGVFARRDIPYVGSCGALDMVNFGPRDTVPERFRGRNLVSHNANVTLMRTTRDENAAIGRWIGERLNRMRGPVRFLIPELGVSALDAPGRPFHDAGADRALFEAIEATVSATGQRKVVRVAAHINDPAFAEALASSVRDIAAPARMRA